MALESSTVFLSHYLKPQVANCMPLTWLLLNKKASTRKSFEDIECIKRLHNETGIYNDKQYDWRCDGASERWSKKLHNFTIWRGLLAALFSFSAVSSYFVSTSYGTIINSSCAQWLERSLSLSLSPLNSDIHKGKWLAFNIQHISRELNWRWAEEMRWTLMVHTMMIRDHLPEIAYKAKRLRKTCFETASEDNRSAHGDMRWLKI